MNTFSSNSTFKRTILRLRNDSKYSNDDSYIPREYKIPKHA